MKKNIHPTYFEDAVIECACGNKVLAGSTKQNTKVELCSACHPFFTGKQKLVDKAGRVERFTARLQASKTKQADLKKPTKRKV